MHLINRAFRKFVLKITQDPDYYNIKHYNKLRRKFMRDEERG